MQMVIKKNKELKYKWKRGITEEKEMSNDGKGMEGGVRRKATTRR